MRISPGICTPSLSMRKRIRLASLGGTSVGLPQAVRGEGHLPEDRPRVYHFQGELSCAFSPVEAHPTLLEDEELAALLPGSVEGFTYPKKDVRILTDEDPYLLLGE